MSWQQKVQTVWLEPYLPPPVVRTIREHVDPFLRQHLGFPEGTMVIVITNLVALWMFTTLIQWMFFTRGTSSKDNTDGRRATLFSTTRKGGKAIVQNEEEEDDNDDMDSAARFLSLASIRLLKQSTLSLSSSDDVVTVLLCGPSNAGKTCIFHKLMMMHDANNKNNNKKLPLTLTSLKANVGVAHTDTVIRYIDWPGHAAAASNLLLSSSSSSSTTTPSSFVQQDPTLWQLWNDTLFSTSSRRRRLPSSSSSSSGAAPLLPPPPLRIVMVLDATQPVKEAAAIFFQLWNCVALTTAAATDKNNSWSRSNHPPPVVPIMIACHKQDLSKAKNIRRIRLQLRTELEKILAVQQPSWWPCNNNNNGSGNGRITYELTSSTNVSSKNSKEDMEEDGPSILPGFVQWQFLPTSCNDNVDNQKNNKLSGTTKTQQLPYSPLWSNLQRYCQMGEIPK